MGAEQHRRWQYYRCRGSFRASNRCRAAYSNLSRVHQGLERVYQGVPLSAGDRTRVVRLATGHTLLSGAAITGAGFFEIANGGGLQVDAGVTVAATNLALRLLKKQLTEIVRDVPAPALEKLQRFFDIAAQWKSAHRALMVELTHVWYADHNAIVRQKWLAMQSKNTLSLITHIFRQGMQEDVFHIAFPDQIGSIFLWLMQGFGDAVAELMLVHEPFGDELQRAEGLVAAYNDAVERLLGAPTGSVKLIDAEALREWFSL